MATELHIRRATTDDEVNVFILSNDELVRHQSIQSAPISWSSHVQWFRKAIISPDWRFYIVETQNNHFVGQIRFKKENGYWVASISVHSDYRGKGLAAIILQKALNLMPAEPIIAYIKENNYASQRIFIANGFIFQRTQKINGSILHIYQYSA